MSNTENIEAKLAAYVDGELDAAGRAEIEAYTASNPKHRPLIEALRRDRAALANLPRATVPIDLSEVLSAQFERAALLGDVDIGADGGEQPAGRLRQFGAVAAVILVTTSLAGVLYVMLPSPKPRPPQVAIVTPDLPAPASRSSFDREGRERDSAKDSLASGGSGAVAGSKEFSTGAPGFGATQSESQVDNQSRLTQALDPSQQQQLLGQQSKSSAGAQSQFAQSGQTPRDQLTIAASPSASPAALPPPAPAPVSVPSLPSIDARMSALSDQPDDLSRANAAIAMADQESQGPVQSAANNAGLTSNNLAVEQAGGATREALYLVIHADNIAAAKREMAGYLTSNQIAFQQPGAEETANAPTAAEAIREVDQANLDPNNPARNATTSPNGITALKPTTSPTKSPTPPAATGPAVQGGAIADAASASNVAAASPLAPMIDPTTQPAPSLDKMATTSPTHDAAHDALVTANSGGLSVSNAAPATTARDRTAAPDLPGAIGRLATSQPADSSTPIVGNSTSSSIGVVVARGLTRQQVNDLSNRFGGTSATTFVDPPRTFRRARAASFDGASKAAVTGSVNVATSPSESSPSGRGSGANMGGGAEGASSMNRQKFLEAGATSRPATQPAIDQRIALRAGDGLRIRARDVALGVEPIDETAIVNASGKINLPRIGDVTVAGMAPAVAAAKLPHALADDPVKAELAWSIEHIPAELIPVRALPPQDQSVDVVVLFRSSGFPTADTTAATATAPATSPTTNPVR